MQVNNDRNEFLTKINADEIATIAKRAERDWQKLHIIMRIILMLNARYFVKH
jgi:hypothetical protein